LGVGWTHRSPQLGLNDKVAYMTLLDGVIQRVRVSSLAPSLLLVWTERVGRISSKASGNVQHMPKSCLLQLTSSRLFPLLTPFDIACSAEALQAWHSVTPRVDGTTQKGCGWQGREVNGGEGRQQVQRASREQLGTMKPSADAINTKGMKHHTDSHGFPHNDSSLASSHLYSA